MKLQKLVVFWLGTMAICVACFCESPISADRLRFMMLDDNREVKLVCTSFIVILLFKSAKKNLNAYSLLTQMGENKSKYAI